MGVAVQKGMTLAEVLDWEGGQELRYEFDGFQPVAMTGARDMRRLAFFCAFPPTMRRGRCRLWGPTAKIEVQGHIRYPDAYVSCTPVSPIATIIPGPVVVFEVLSPSTSRTDRIEKLREYQATPSIQRYVILEQDSVAAMVFVRHGDDWTGTALTEVDTLRMPEIGIELELVEIYADADFGHVAAEPAA